MMRKALAFLLCLSAAMPAMAQTATPFQIQPQQTQPQTQPLAQPQSPAPATTQAQVPPTAPSGTRPATPFDMAPERPPQPTPPPMPQTPVTPVAPSSQPNLAAPAPSGPSAVSPAVAPAPAAQQNNRRYLVPQPDLRLNGEIEQRAWSVFLTPQEAADNASLTVSYQNSVFVAPEASQLSLTINDVQIFAEKIASADQPTEKVFKVPAGVLRAGNNTVRIAASQRHRTDCTIESTYELWTQIDPKKTYLRFSNANAARFSRLDDLRALGVDGQGQTRFRLIVPALDQLGTTDILMRLAQGLSVMGGMPNQSFSFQRAPQGALLPGELPVFVGTPEELRGMLPSLPTVTTSAAAASFIDYAGADGAAALVLSGPSWPALQGLIESFVASTDSSGNSATIQRRDTLSTANWHGYDTPFLFSQTLLNLDSLGVTSQEFSGRLFRTSFTVGVPADFYANAYGEARILLDAAYSADVEPGSHIDVFVNGNIASTVPITSSGGAILRHLPIKLTLRHFKPGVNTITIEAALVATPDKVCAPGSTAEGKARFAIFGTSQFSMPDFARIAQVPNLAATAGTGYPYGTTTEPISLFLGRIDEKTLGAAATLLGKMAWASHRVLPVNVTISTARIAGRNAVFVGAASEFPANILAQFKIDQTSRTTWSEGTAAPPGTPGTLTLQDWQQRNGDSFFARQFAALADWAKRNFDLSAQMLRFAPSDDTIYTPPQSAKAILAQDSDPTDTGTWTALIATDTDHLAAGMEKFATRDGWNQLNGRIAIYSGADADIATVPVNWFRFVPPAEFSLSNIRLIAANWLSDNIMSYGLLLAAGAVLLGLATAGLLGRLGRK